MAFVKEFVIDAETTDSQPSLAVLRIPQSTRNRFVGQVGDHAQYVGVLSSGVAISESSLVEWSS